MNVFNAIKRHSEKAGLPPGSIVYTERKKLENPIFRIMDYDKKTIIEKKLTKIEEAFPFKESKRVTWLDITGLHESNVIGRIGEVFELHPLIQEDIVSTGKRPSFADFNSYLFIVLKMLNFDSRTGEIASEHVSLIVGKDYIISFQESDSAAFDSVRERIRDAKWTVRKSGSDYLAYVLIDAIIDNYFKVLEKLGDKMGDLEEELDDNPTQDTLTSINDLKRELIFLRKSIWPLRELINKMQKSESRIIKKQTKVYLSDLYDHVIQAMDTVESFRDLAGSMLDVYMSSVSNRLNEIMKVLTILSTIFIPLTFVSGIYGMNFEFMPEIHWKYGYLFVWGVFIAMALVMIYYFKKKEWI
ncbi:magnesium/cobalt transporter CorA [Candidatus Woesearchaeota archaeon]|nr:magnesium/cobalt transporter CorA [Candidatus Woesearchaeota archaeon]